jgi:hypothetical protein
MRVVLVLVVAAILSIVWVADAQQALTCETLVTTALNQLGTNCATLQRGFSCFGYPGIAHTSFDPVQQPDFYAEPGDVADLNITETIQSGPLVLVEEVYGINVMDVEANIPADASDKGVVFLQVGGVEVENGVEPVDAFLPLEAGVDATTTSATDLLTWPAPSVPGYASETLLTVPSGAAVTVDAVTPELEFARTVYQNRAGWVALADLESASDLSSLPALNREDDTPMQDFYFRTGIGGVNCSAAPSLLYLQGPNNVSTDLTVFDKHIRVQSTAILRSSPLGDQLGDYIEVIVLSGVVILNPDTANEIIVPPGFLSRIQLCDEFASLGIEGDPDEKCTVGEWSQPRPLTQDELNELGIVEKFPDNIVNYPVDIPTIVHPSCTNGCYPSLVFPNQTALDAARPLCQAGDLSPDTCQYLGL